MRTWITLTLSHFLWARMRADHRASFHDFIVNIELKTLPI